jgi:hypothetical protein
MKQLPVTCACFMGLLLLAFVLYTIFDFQRITGFTNNSSQHEGVLVYRECDFKQDPVVIVPGTYEIADLQTMKLGSVWNQYSIRVPETYYIRITPFKGSNVSLMGPTERSCLDDKRKEGTDLSKHSGNSVAKVVVGRLG